MKRLKRKISRNLILILPAILISLYLFTGCQKENQPPQLNIKTIVSGLRGPMGIETDAHGNILVSEAGTDTSGIKGDTHNNDGKVLLITPEGEKYDMVVHLSSYANKYSGELQGTVHILRDRETLYILSGDYLYRADISHFKPGDPPMDAATLPYEDLAAFASQNALTYNPQYDSHPYNLAKGPDGDLYIADAGANAIIHRKDQNDYTVLAEIPSFPNPTPQIGGPVIQAVPTSIEWDGKDFLVTTLTGFPFPKGQATIFKVSMSGKVSVYQKGLTMVVDQAKGNGSNHLVVQYASSFNPASGYAPQSGSLEWVNGKNTKLLADQLNQPVGIKQANRHTWYVTVLGDGTVLKVTYY